MPRPHIKHERAALPHRSGDRCGPASHRRVTGSLTPWVRDDLPSATVFRGALSRHPAARPPRAEARTASHNPRLAKSPKWFRERAIEHAAGRCGVPDHAGFATHCSTSLGYEPGFSGRVPEGSHGRVTRVARPALGRGRGWSTVRRGCVGWRPGAPRERGCRTRGRRGTRGWRGCRRR